MKNNQYKTAQAANFQEAYQILIDSGFRLVRVMPGTDSGSEAEQLPGTNITAEEYEMLLEEEMKEARRKSELERLETEVDNPQLVNELRQWRREKAKEEDVPSYFVLSNKTLLMIALRAPANMDELLAVNGFGTTKGERYGKEILEIVAENMEEARVFSR